MSPGPLLLTPRLPAQRLPRRCRGLRLPPPPRTCRRKGKGASALGAGDGEGAGKCGPRWPRGGRRAVGVGWGRRTRGVCDSVGGVETAVRWTPSCLEGPEPCPPSFLRVTGRGGGRGCLQEGVALRGRRGGCSPPFKRREAPFPSGPLRSSLSFVVSVFSGRETVLGSLLGGFRPRPRPRPQEISTPLL